LKDEDSIADIAKVLSEEQEEEIAKD
jgi:hypothetical protein